MKQKRFSFSKSKPMYSMELVEQWQLTVRQNRIDFVRSLYCYSQGLFLFRQKSQVSFVRIFRSVK